MVELEVAKTSDSSWLPRRARHGQWEENARQHPLFLVQEEDANGLL